MSDQNRNECSYSEKPNSSDTISRQTAINEIARWKGYLDADMIMRIQIGIKRLPSTQPEPITAYWKKDAFGTVICSKCGGIRRDNRVGHTQWCNSCGCFMRGEQE